MTRPALQPWTPSAEQQALWPPISGDTINGVGEARVRRPSPIYWHAPDATPHGLLQLWFIRRSTPLVLAARQERQAVLDEPIPPVSGPPAERTPEAWAREVKAAAYAAGADGVGITRVQPQWVFEGQEVTQRWAIVLCAA